jgi:hypothetical protein
LGTFNSFVNARYSDISVDCNDFDAGFHITYRKIKFYTAKINDIPRNIILLRKSQLVTSYTLKLDVNRCF